MAEWNRAVIETAGPKVIDLSASFLDIRQVNDPAAQMAPMQTNRTKEIVNALVLNSVQNQRYMRIGIGAFSIVLAGIIILRIFYDSWRASQLQVKLHPKRFSWITDLHPAEVFPLALSIVTIVQQITLIAVQSATLTSVNAKGCDKSAQIVFPTMFLLAYIHLVFGGEYTIRAFQSKRFSPRKPWTTRICLAVFGLLLILTWLPSNIIRAPQKCYGDIIWRPFRVIPIGLGITSAMIVIFMGMAAIIGMRLIRTVNIDPNERIAASRVFYYLIASIVLQILMLPFFIQGVLGDFDKDLSSARLAELDLVGAGIIISLIHIFLRTNALRTALKPVQTAWTPKRKFRFFGNSDLEIVNISPPVNLLGPRDADYYTNEKDRTNTRNEYRIPDEKTPFEAENLYTIPRTPAGRRESKWPLPAEPLSTPKPAELGGASSPTRSPPPTARHKRTPTNYSLFPNAEDEGPKLPAAVYSPTSPPPVEKKDRPESPKRIVQPDRSISAILDDYSSSRDTFQPSDQEPLILLQPTTYTPLEKSKQEVDSLFLQPPAPNFAINNHRRGSSASSTATLQIGLRLSMAPSAAIGAPSSVPSWTPPPPPASGPSRLKALMTPPAEESESSSTVTTPAASSASQDVMLENPSKLLQQRQMNRMIRQPGSSQAASQDPPKPNNGTDYFPKVAPLKPIKTEKELPPTPQRGISGLQMNPPTPTTRTAFVGAAVSTSPSSRLRSPGPGFF